MYYSGWNITKYSLLYLLSGLTALGVGHFAAKRRKIPGAAYISCMMIAIAEWTLMGFFELSSTGVADKVFWSKVEYLGTAAAPVYFLFFCFEYSRASKYIKWPVSILWWIAPVVTNILAFTNESHKWIWKDFILRNDSSNLMIYVHGPGLWIFLVSYSYLCFFIGTGLLLLTFAHVSSSHRPQLLSVLIGALVPWAANILYVFGLSPVPGLDLTPVSLLFSGIILSYAIFRLDFLNVVPIVREKIIETMSDGVITLDGEEKIIDYNSAVLKWFPKQNQPEMKKRICDILIKWPDVKNALLSAGEHRLETASLFEDGMWAELFVSLISDDDGSIIGYLLTFHDITDRKKAEDAIYKAKAAAESANETKDKFIASMSHEIRTPINGITGFLELLERSDLKREQLDYVREAKGASKILLSLINDILDISKIEAGKFSIEETFFSIRKTVENAAMLFAARAAQKNIELGLSIDAGIAEETLGDPARLTQVLNNLIGNAIKFTEKGSVIIGLNSSQASDGYIDVTFSVRDTGIGILKQNIGRLFVPFVQADSSTFRKYGGSGLGLSISRQIVRMMGGDIKVESEFQKGSTFSFSVKFKLVKQRPDNFDELSEILKNVKAVIAISDSHTRDSIASFLKFYGNVPVISEGIASAVRDSISGFGADAPVIIADYSEIKIYSELSYRGPGAIFLVDFSHRSESERMAQAVDKVKFIYKPLRINELLKGVVSLIRPDGCGVIFADESAAENSAPYFDSSSVKVLAVDDNPTNRKLIDNILKNSGMECDVAASGAEALKMYANNEYSLILMDCQMPEMDGYECSRIIREREEGMLRVPIIAMTADAMSGARKKCLDAGMDDYITKPLDFDIFFKKITQHLSPSALELEMSEITKPLANCMAVFYEKNRPLLSRREVQKIFYDYALSVKPGFNSIRKAFENNNFSELANLAHKLRGISGTLFIDPVYNIAIDLEENAKNSVRDKCADLIDSMSAFYRDSGFNID